MHEESMEIDLNHNESEFEGKFYFKKHLKVQFDIENVSRSSKKQTHIPQ